jgi:E3 ubiquitin-protein ligase BOI-like protein
MARDVLVRKNEEISHLRMELHNTQEFVQTVLQERDEFQYFATGFYEMNKSLISQLPPMQATNVHAHGLLTELESTGSCSQAPNMEGASMGRTHTNLLCKICCACDACMLILPCQHLCACKLCRINLTVCPVCYSAKDSMIEARFGW